MRKLTLMRLIQQARSRAQREISGVAEQGSMYARGLSSEGYSGGYRDALDDVMLLIHAGVVPNRYPYWSGVTTREKEK